MRVPLIIVSLVIANQAMAIEFEDYDYSRWSGDITECDNLAAHARDPGHIGTPVTSETMDKEAAIAACRRAVEADPENPRLNYQLARAYGYSGRGEEAKKLEDRVRAIRNKSAGEASEEPEG